MTKKLNPLEKRNRKPALRACVFCHSKHLQCSNERPCKNCVKRNIHHHCHDVVRKRAKYLNTNGSRKQTKSRSNSVNSDNSTNINITGTVYPTTADSIKTVNSTNTLNSDISSPSPVIKHEFAGALEHSLQDAPSNQPISSTETKLQNPMLNTTNDVLNKLLFNDSINKSDNDIDSISLNDSISNNNINSFNSNYLNQEYLMLSDIILHSKPSSPSPSNTSASDYNLGSTVSPSSTLLNNKLNIDCDHPNKRIKQHLKDSRPFISLGFSNDVANDTENGNQIMSNMKTTDNNEYVSPLISHHLYQSVQDIYSNNIINFDYPQSYHSLTKFLKERFSGNSLSDEEKQAKRKSLLIILKLVASYRPTFISAHKSLLKPYDLQFLEMSFQRSLIDYERLSQLNSSPTIMWRRTGEIVSITDDLLSLLGYNLADILSKRTFIMELMYDDESVTNYFKLFKSVAVGNLHSSIITKCKLSKSQHKKSTSRSSLYSEYEESSDKGYIEFCSVWTVKRDIFDLPMLIIGQFLPILPAGEGVRMY